MKFRPRGALARAWPGRPQAGTSISAELQLTNLGYCFVSQLSRPGGWADRVGRKGLGKVGRGGPFKVPRGSLKGTRGPLKGTRGPFEGPRDPLKGPRGPLKGPRGPFKGHRRPSTGDRRPATVDRRPPTVDRRPPRLTECFACCAGTLGARWLGDPKIIQSYAFTWEWHLRGCPD